MLKEAHDYPHSQPEESHVHAQVADLQSTIAAYQQQLGSSQQRILSLEQQLIALKQLQSEADLRATNQADQLVLERMSCNDKTVYADKAAGKVYAHGGKDSILYQCGFWNKRTGVQLFQQAQQLSTGLAQLQQHAAAKSTELQQAFDQFDTDHMGSVTIHSIPGLLRELLPRASADDLQLIQSQLALQDKDRLTMSELLDSITASLQAADAIMAAEAAVPEDFQQLRDCIKQRQQELCDLFGVYDSNGIGTVDMRQLAQLLRRLLSNITESQMRQLVTKLHTQGTRGTVSLQDLFDALHLGAAPKLHSGMHVRSSVNASPAAASKPSSELQALRHQLAQLKQTAQHHAQACSSKDAELIAMRHALRQLQQDLHTAEQQRLASPAAYGVPHGTEALEAQISAAWDKANVLKTRFIDTKNAFEQLKAQHARVIQVAGVCCLLLEPVLGVSKANNHIGNGLLPIAPQIQSTVQR